MCSWFLDAKTDYCSADSERVERYRQTVMTQTPERRNCDGISHAPLIPR